LAAGSGGLWQWITKPQNRLSQIGVKMPDGNQSPDIKGISRRDFLKLVGVGIGGFGLWRLGEGIVKAINAAGRENETRFKTADLNSEQQEFLRGSVVERLFLPPQPEEIEAGYAYFTDTKFEVEKPGIGSGVYQRFFLKTPDRLSGIAAAAISPEKLGLGEISWFLTGTPPGSFNSDNVNSHRSLEYVGFTKLDAPGIELGEPNQSGFESYSPDYLGSGFKSMHGKGLAASGLLRLLTEGKFGINIPAGRFLELAGYSGGANAALVVGSHYPERLVKLLTFSSSYDMFHEEFKNRCLSAISQGFRQGNVLFWGGEEFFGKAVEAAKSTDPIVRESFLKQDLTKMRKLMLRLSPYYWIEKVTPNSFVWEIAHGRLDDVAPFSQAEQLIRKLVELGWNKDHLRIFVHDGGHGSVLGGEMIDPQSFVQK